MFHVKHKPGHIPSPRALKLTRFNRPDFRAPRKAKHREGDWIWRRAVYRARRWFQQALAAVRNRAHLAVPVMPNPVLTVKLTANVHTYQRQVKSAATVARRFTKQVRRDNAPARLAARRPGAHRLDRLVNLPSKAYMTALDARQLYVTANLLRLKGLAGSRAFGETSWREARRADHYATA